MSPMSAARAPLMALALATTAFAPMAARAQDAEVAKPVPIRGTALTLSAFGETGAAPDKAVLSLGVAVRAPTAQAAMAENARRMAAVVAAVRGQGVAEKDIQTSGLNLSARYRYPDDAAPVLEGYEAANQLSVTIYDLGRVGAVADAVVGAGANKIDGVAFGLKDEQAAQDAARLEAVHRLQDKARLYAQAAGLHVGRLVSLNETSAETPTPRPPVLYMARASAPSPKTQVQPGQLTVRVEVQGVYELN